MTPHKGLTSTIIGFVARKTRIPPEQISEDSALLHDLGVDGDDAIEFLSDFCVEFGVDVGDIKFGRYFNHESSFLNPLWFLPSSRERRKNAKIPLRVRSLVRAASFQKWLD